MGHIIHPLTGAKIAVHGPAMGPTDSTPHQPDKKYTEKQSKKTDDKKWIKEAIKNPGSLRKTLGVKENEKIPAKKLAEAAEKSGITGKRARLAQTLKTFNKK